MYAPQPAHRPAPANSPRPLAARASHDRAAPSGWTQPGTDAAREVSFLPGQTIFFDGDEAEFFFEIVSGTVRCCRLTPDGRRQIFRFAGTGELLGLGGEEVHSYSAEAVTAVRVRRHRLATLDAALAGDGALRQRVLQALRDELAAVRTHLMLLGQMSAGAKVAAFFLAELGRADDPSARLQLTMSRADIADYLGLTVETVSRKVNELKRLRVIDLETSRDLRIADPARLEAIAEAA